MHTYTPIPKVYTLLLSRDLKNKKVGPRPTLHPPLNKTKISGIKSEILIKYKRIKWTTSRKGFSFSPRGIRTGEYNDKSLTYFTLTELIILSNKNVDVRNIKKIIYPSTKLKNTNSNQSLDTFDKKNALKFENTLIQKVPKIEIVSPVKNHPWPKKYSRK